MQEIWQYLEQILKIFLYILITSVPSIETYNNIQNKKYRHIKIFKRFNDYPLPKIKNS